MTRLSKFKWALAILGLQLIVVLYFAGILPADAKVPIHWNIRNQIDGWVGRNVGLAWGIGLNVLMFLLLYLMPWYSPWYRRYEERFERVVPALTAILLFFFGVISVYALYVAKWGEPQGVNMILVLIGFLFICLGNLLPKVPKNFFIGIKTPWTLANETVWDKTHRLGGILFVVSGLIMILKGFVLAGHAAFQTGSAVLAFGLVLYPILYSFILYKRRGE